MASLLYLERFTIFEPRYQFHCYRPLVATTLTASRAKSEFLSTMSHEIRMPMIVPLHCGRFQDARSVKFHPLRKPMSCARRREVLGSRNVRALDAGSDGCTIDQSVIEAYMIVCFRGESAKEVLFCGDAKTARGSLSVATKAVFFYVRCGASWSS
jgi:hypothetical protein